MTIKEYLKKNHMTNSELAELVGCPTATITRILKFDTAVKNLEHYKRFKELGIEVRAYDPKANRKKESGTGYLYYEKMWVSRTLTDDIYCYTPQKLNAFTEYLEQRGICYYVVAKEGYWVVKYDRRIEEEEWLQ